MLSGILGTIYGKAPRFIGLIVPIITIIMGLNLLGILKIALPDAPKINTLEGKIAQPLVPFAAGMTFGLASSPCTTPVLAVLLTWIAENGNPASGIILLTCFGLGQVMPLFLAGTTAASIPRILSIRFISQWIPALSGAFFLSTGLLSLFARWI